MSPPTTPETMPAIGLAPEAMAKAMHRGRATTATMKPANRLFRRKPEKRALKGFSLAEIKRGWAARRAGRCKGAGQALPGRRRRSGRLAQGRWPVLAEGHEGEPSGVV